MEDYLSCFEPNVLLLVILYHKAKLAARTMFHMCRRCNREIPKTMTSLKCKSASLATPGKSRSSASCEIIFINAATDLDPV